MWRNLGGSLARFDKVRLRRFARSLGPAHARVLRLNAAPLRGGLQAAGIARVRAQLCDAGERRSLVSFVVKRLVGPEQRELAAYRALRGPALERLAPRMLGFEALSADETYLYLEHIVSGQRWPWTDQRLAAALIERLAHLHGRAEAASAAETWDYETELRDRSAETLQLMEDARQHAALRPLVAFRPALRRVVDALPRMRRDLREGPLAAPALHGDVHPGNVMVRKAGAAQEPVLIDWSRTRPGSGLEDVSSWLQSLGFWEPKARRSHDRLLRVYLAGRGLSTALTRELRDRYWLAGASNALAGALLFHLAVAQDPARTPGEKATSIAAARDWLRIVRRADACWAA